MSNKKIFNFHRALGYGFATLGAALPVSAISNSQSVFTSSQESPLVFDDETGGLSLDGQKDDYLVHLPQVHNLLKPKEDELVFDSEPKKNNIQPPVHLDTKNSLAKQDVTLKSPAQKSPANVVANDVAAPIVVKKLPLVDQSNSVSAIAVSSKPNAKIKAEKNIALPAAKEIQVKNSGPVAPAKMSGQVEIVVDQTNDVKSIVEKSQYLTITIRQTPKNAFSNTAQANAPLLANAPSSNNAKAVDVKNNNQSVELKAAIEAELALSNHHSLDIQVAADTKAKADAQAMELKAVADAKAKADAQAMELKAAADAKVKADAQAVELKAVADAKAKADAQAMELKVAADTKAKADAQAVELKAADAKVKAELKAAAEIKAKADLNERIMSEKSDLLSQKQNYVYKTNNPSTSALQKATSFSYAGKVPDLRTMILGFNANEAQAEAFSKKYEYDKSKLAVLPKRIGSIVLNPIVKLNGEQLILFRSQADKEIVDEYMAYHPRHAEVFSNYVKRILLINSGQNTAQTMNDAMVNELTYNFASTPIKAATINDAQDQYLYITSRLSEIDQAKFWNWVNTVKTSSQIKVPSWVRLVDVMYSQ